MSNCNESASKLSFDPRSDSSNDCSEGTLSEFIMVGLGCKHTALSLLEICGGPIQCIADAKFIIEMIQNNSQNFHSTIGFLFFPRYPPPIQSIQSTPSG